MAAKDETSQESSREPPLLDEADYLQAWRYQTSGTIQSWIETCVALEEEALRGNLEALRDLLKHNHLYLQHPGFLDVLVRQIGELRQQVLLAKNESTPVLDEEWTFPTINDEVWESFDETGCAPKREHPGPKRSEDWGAGAEHAKHELRKLGEALGSPAYTGQRGTVDPFLFFQTYYNVFSLIYLIRHLSGGLSDLKLRSSKARSLLNALLADPRPYLPAGDGKQRLRFEADLSLPFLTIQFPFEYPLTEEALARLASDERAVDTTRTCVAWLFGISESRADQEKARARTIFREWSHPIELAPPPDWPILGDDVDDRVRPDAGAWFLATELIAAWSKTLTRRTEGQGCPPLADPALNEEMLSHLREKAEVLRRALIGRLSTGAADGADVVPEAHRVFLERLENSGK